MTCLNPWDSQGNKVYSIDGVFPCLRGTGHGYPIGMILYETNSLCGMVKAEQRNEIGQSIQRLCIGNQDSKDA